MNKADYLAELKVELASITSEERDAAIDYYSEYFEDAGEENEQTVISELGSAAKVAASIKANCGNVPEPLRTADEVKHNVVNNSTAPNNSSRTILLVLLAIVTFPLWIGIVGAAFGLLVAGIAIIFAFFIVGIALIISGIAFVISGIMMLSVSFSSAFVMSGAGLVLAGIGVLITAGMCFIIGKGIPFVGRCIGNLFKSIFGKRRND
ncbi:MAG: DUF1700 domain-containing protein [Oscillospiraceae bacterium]